MAKLPHHKESKWPHLASEGYSKESVETWNYNCIGFAADHDDEWWWPDQHGIGIWPKGVKREVTREAFIAAYESIGYEECKSPDLEKGFDKVVIYLLNGIPTHATKQLRDGRWKSKLGPWEDIEHNTLKAVEEYIYGKAAIYMRREIK